MLAKYDAVIQEQLSLGIIVPVSENENSFNRVHHLPHHAVIRHDKSTTKVSVVYDASAKIVWPNSLSHREGERSKDSRDTVIQSVALSTNLSITMRLLHTCGNNFVT